MPRFTSHCESCGFEEEIWVEGGNHPPCIKCANPTIYMWRATGASHGIVTDESFIGGLVVENLGHDPVTVYSRQDLARKMQIAGVEQRIKYVPGDKFLTDWSKSIDPYTMAAAKALVERPEALLDRTPPKPLLQITTEVHDAPPPSVDLIHR